MQALIIANGEPPSDRLLRGCVSAAALVVGADGGADVARRAGITVHLATGDLDSITDAVRDSLGPARLFVDRDPGNAGDFLWRRLDEEARAALAMRLQPAPADAPAGLRWMARHRLVVPT